MVVWLACKRTQVMQVDITPTTAVQTLMILFGMCWRHCNHGEWLSIMPITNKHGFAFIHLEYNTALLATSRRLLLLHCFMLLQVSTTECSFFYPLCDLCNCFFIWRKCFSKLENVLCNSSSCFYAYYITVERWMAVSLCGQQESHLWSYYPATRLQSLSFNLVNTEPFPHRSGPLCCQSLQMAHGLNGWVSMWRCADDEPHRRVLSANQIHWWRWFVSTSLGGWLRNHVATERHSESIHEMKYAYTVSCICSV